MDNNNDYIPRYKNASSIELTKLYNKCLDTIESLHLKWFGSAYGVTTYDVLKLQDDILHGKTTITKFKREFNQSAYNNCLP